MQRVTMYAKEIRILCPKEDHLLLKVNFNMTYQHVYLVLATLV